MTAVFGGAFDPPHLGHREAIEGLFGNPGVRDVIVLPSGNPPWKPGASEAIHRLAMARLAFEGAPGLGSRLALDDREILAAKLGKPTFAYDALVSIRRERPRLACVIGSDQLEGLPRWYRFPEILGLCEWIVLRRRSPADGPGEPPGWLAQGFLGRELGPGIRELRPGGRAMAWVETRARGCSSTEIRERMERSGRAPRDDLAPGVRAYLILHRLYGTRPLDE